MAEKPVRLRFSEEELADPKVAKAAARSEKATVKAGKAQGKIPVKHKLSRESSSAANARKKLRFGKLVLEEVEAPKPKKGIKDAATRAPLDTVSGTAHREVRQYEEDNVGVKAAHQTEEAAEGAVHATEHALYSGKLKKYEKAEKLTRKSDNANVEALYKKYMAEHPEAVSNPISKWMQKRKIKKAYAAARAAGTVNAVTHATNVTTAGFDFAARVSAKGAKDKVASVFRTVTSRTKALLIFLGIAAILILLASFFSVFPLIIQGSVNSILGSTYTAEDWVILAVDADYSSLESALQTRINNIESEYPGYDEYRYDLAEIGHNPFELASYLTVVYEDYKRKEVQDELERLFEEQYTLTIIEVIETRTRTETRTGTKIVTYTDPETGETSESEVTYEYQVEVEYDYHILNVSLTNSGLGAVVASSGLTDTQMSRYALLMTTYGNKKYLFSDDIYSVSTDTSEYSSYEVSAEALSDDKFANMIAEAEKYLGFPYVWGGSSPSTSFDCSGFVCWVINNCGNGWNVGRTTAEGLRQYCTYVSPSEAQPGDLIFFQGTYDTTGASHVGIYVGNGMMIHCGNPIQYTSIETSYWQGHFLSYGRLP